MSPDTHLRVLLRRCCCSECDDGWTSATCGVQDLCQGLPLCSGHGACKLDADASPPSLTCNCDRDYHGADCHAHLPCARDCSGHGLCDRGVCLCDQGFTDTLIAEVKAKMEAAAELRVPLIVDVGTGKNWDEAH